MQIENKLCIHLKVEKCFCWGKYFQIYFICFELSIRFRAE